MDVGWGVGGGIRVQGGGRYPCPMDTFFCFSYESQNFINQLFCTIYCKTLFRTNFLVRLREQTAVGRRHGDHSTMGYCLEI